MLLVKTRIGESRIHGIGLFADEFIPKGTVTWEYDPELDFSFTKEKLDSFPKNVRDYFLFYCYYDKKRDLYIMPTDHLKFINHSANSNLINIESTPDQDIASRDIKPGEELLCDYNKFDDTYFDRIGLKSNELK